MGVQQEAQTEFYLEFVVKSNHKFRSLVQRGPQWPSTPLQNKLTSDDRVHLYKMANYKTLHLTQLCDNKNSCHIVTALLLKINFNAVPLPSLPSFSELLSIVFTRRSAAFNYPPSCPGCHNFHNIALHYWNSIWQQYNVIQQFFSFYVTIPFKIIVTKRTLLLREA